MSQFKQFETAKQSILNDLYLAQNFSNQNGLENYSERFSTLHQTLYRDQFEVMVVGEFSNGKSTFINALMKGNILPSSNVPTTAFINKIYYADTPKFSVHFDNGKKETLNQQEFLAYVSEDKRQSDFSLNKVLQKVNPLTKNTTHLEIGYPAEICKNDIVLIDSPGTNDMDERRVKITDEYIPKSDAAIFVLSAKKIFSASERAFLLRILDADIRKIFFVINFKDNIHTEEEFKEIKQIVLDNLPTTLNDPKIYFISALHALKHYLPVEQSTNPRKRLQQAKLLPFEETGLQELESALFEFLSNDSGRTKLEKPVLQAQKLLSLIIEDNLAFEVQSLSHAISDIESHVATIKNDLKFAENQIKSESQLIYRQISQESKAIVTWYKQCIVKISEVANETLSTCLNSNMDFENIKYEIDMATSPFEKSLKAELQAKTNQMITDIFSTKATELYKNISGLSNQVLNIKNEKSEWGEFVKTKSSDDTVTDMAIGGALVGGALLFLSGGLFGWALLGAGAGAAGAYVLNNSNPDAVDQLRKQVRDRYDKSLTLQAKQIEKDFESLANELKGTYEKYSRELIKNEYSKTEKLVSNQQLNAEDQLKKINELNNQISIGQSLSERLNTAFNKYCEAGR